MREMQIVLTNKKKYDYETENARNCGRICATKG